MKYLFAFVLLGVGLAVGNWFPDIDQDTGLLLHRSIVTHGPLVPLIAVAIAATSRTILLRWFALGLVVGFAVHLSFDLFPKGWSGFALISIPVYGWTAPWFSATWIAISTILCTYLAIKLVKNGLDGFLLIMLLIFSFGYISISEDALLKPAVTLTVAASITFIPTVRRALFS